MPPDVTTVMSTVPAPVGATAVIWVAELTLKLVAFLVPNLTAVAPVRYVPVMVTEVPPEVGPLAVEIPATVGAAK